MPRRSARKGARERPAPPARGVETRVFRSGNSDAVRIPAQFRMSGARVRVRQLGDGRLLIEPVRKRSWPAGFLESFAGAFADFEPPAREGADVARDRRLASLLDDAAE